MQQANLRINIKRAPRDGAEEIAEVLVSSALVLRVLWWFASCSVLYIWYAAFHFLVL